MNSTNRTARILAQGLVDARVETMLRDLDRRGPDMRERLAAAPISEIQSWPELEVAYIDMVARSSECTIAGAYIDSVEPAVIGIVSGTFSRRESFTALHELGHHLQRNSMELIEALPAQPDRGRALEEATCDAFAASVLISPERSTEVLGTGTPTAAAVVQLWRSTSASRAAVCVRAAQRLESPGHVLLLNHAGEIEFASSHNDYPLARGLDQSQCEIFRAITTSQFDTVSKKTRFRYRGGSESSEYYAQATEIDGYFLVVAVVDRAPWERISLSPATSSFVAKWHECAHCGEVALASTLETCEGCAELKCAECGGCGCLHHVEERLCTGCFLLKPAQQFEAGSSVCVDC